MAIELSTAGISIRWAVEQTAGTQPTSGYATIAGIKSIADINPEPSSLEVTDLSDTEWRRYIAGLKDPGGSIALGANNTEAFQTDWAALVEAYETAAESDKAMWFAVVIPKLDNAFYFAGEPAALGLGAIDVDSVLEIDAYIAPRRITGWAVKPTN